MMRDLLRSGHANHGKQK